MNREHGDELTAQTPLESRAVHKGRIVNLAIETVRYPDGSTGDLEMIRHSGAAAVLPFLDPLDDPDPRVILVKQFRYAGGGYLYEVPAGRPDKIGEPWERCALRELQEETGYTSSTIIPLTSILTTPGFTDERIHLFAATDLTSGEVLLDEDEFMEIVTIRFSEALDLVRSGAISDGKTICTILYAAQFLRS
jgi:ADP-ribose pyrophosphatase